jgi:hypothetical protein
LLLKSYYYYIYQHEEKRTFKTMAPKLNKLKLSPTKPSGGEDLERTLHDVDGNVPALKPKSNLSALGPIKKRADEIVSPHHKHDDDCDIDDQKVAENDKTYQSEAERVISDETMGEYVPGDPAAVDVTHHPAGDVDLREADKEVEEVKYNHERIKTPRDTDLDDMYDVPVEKTKGTEELAKTRMSVNADEYIELSDERAREARIKQQLFSTSIRIMYVDRLNTTSLESQLHRAIYRGDEDEVRRVSRMSTP